MDVPEDLQAGLISLSLAIGYWLLWRSLTPHEPISSLTPNHESSFYDDDDLPRSDYLDYGSDDDDRP